MRSRSGSGIISTGIGGPGAAVQAVCQAIETAAAAKRWVAVREITDGGGPQPAS